MPKENENISRWFEPHEFSAADHLAALKGERPENPAYLKARREVLEDAGFIDEGDGSTSEHDGSDPDYLVTSGEYLRRIQKGSN
jgi:hypothetical protein